MIHESPNPIKRSNQVKDRLLKSPVTTVVGLLLIAGAIYMYKTGLDSTFAMLLGGAGLVSLGLKDK